MHWGVRLDRRRALEALARAALAGGALAACGDARGSSGAGSSGAGGGEPVVTTCAPECAVVNLARGGSYVPFSLTVHGDSVYFVARNTDAQEDGGLFVVPAAGGEAVKLARGPVKAGGFCKGVAADDEFVYFTSDTSHGTQRALRKVPLGGGEVVDLLPIGSEAECVAVDDEAIYYANGSAIFRMPKEGGEPEEIADEGPASMVIRGGFLYYSTFSTIKRVDLERGGSFTLAGQFQSELGLAVDDAYVYASDRHNDAIVRVPHEGGLPEPLVEEEPETWGLVVGNSALYWSRRLSDPAENRIMKLPLGASVPIELTASVGGNDLALGDGGVFWTSVSEAAVRRTSP